MISRERLDELRRKADLTCSFQVMFTDDEMYALLQAYETIGEITQQLTAKDAEIAALKAEVERLKQELAQPWKHSEHWRNPDTGQVECECCCSWALSCEKEHKELVALREQVARLSAPVSDEEMNQFAIHSVDLAMPYRREPALLRSSADALILARKEGR